MQSRIIRLLGAKEGWCLVFQKSVTYVRLHNIATLGAKIRCPAAQRFHNCKFADLSQNAFSQLCVARGAFRGTLPAHRRAQHSPIFPLHPAAGCDILRCCLAGVSPNGAQRILCFIGGGEMTYRTYKTNMTGMTNRTVESLLRAGFAAARCPVGLVCPVSPLIMHKAVQRKRSRR